MKKVLFFLIGLGFLCSCATHAPTGDLQYFDLRGNVSSLDNEYFFPNSTASFDKDGYLIIDDENATVDTLSRLDNYMLKEYRGPFRVIKFDIYEKIGAYENGRPIVEYKDLIYDSSNRLIAIDGIFNSFYLYYDDEGWLCSIVSFEEGGMVTDFTYDKKGTRIKEHCFVPVITNDGYMDRHKVAEENWTLEYERHRFDKHGNWVARWAVKRDLDGTILGESEEFRDGEIKYYDE